MKPPMPANNNLPTPSLLLATDAHRFSQIERDQICVIRVYLWLLFIGRSHQPGRRLMADSIAADIFSTTGGEVEKLFLQIGFRIVIGAVQNCRDRSNEEFRFDWFRYVSLKAGIEGTNAILVRGVRGQRDGGNPVRAL